jgi:hypothetical protein
MDMAFWLSQAEAVLAQVEARRPWRGPFGYNGLHLAQKSIAQGRHQCTRAGLGVESHAHLLSAKAIMERMDVGRVYSK